MKKLFISAPMKGRTEAQIRATMEQMPRVNSLNRAFHLFLERFQRAVNVDHFRVMLWANPQNFHTVNLPNCTSKNINRAVSLEPPFATWALTDWAFDQGLTPALEKYQ